MSRTYDKELSCGCLVSTESNLLVPCMKNDCKFEEETQNGEEVKK